MVKKKKKKNRTDIIKALRLLASLKFDFRLSKGCLHSSTFLEHSLRITELRLIHLLSRNPRRATAFTQGLWEITGFLSSLLWSHICQFPPAGKSFMSLANVHPLTCAPHYYSVCLLSSIARYLQRTVYPTSFHFHAAQFILKPLQSAITLTPNTISSKVTNDS